MQAMNNLPKFNRRDAAEPLRSIFTFQTALWQTSNAGGHGGPPRQTLLEAVTLNANRRLETAVFDPNRLDAWIAGLEPVVLDAKALGGHRSLYGGLSLGSRFSPQPPTWPVWPCGRPQRAALAV